VKLLYLGSHSVLEFDQVRMWSRMGIDVFSIGAYSDPLHPGDPKRPAIPEAQDHPELRAFVHETRVAHEGHDQSYPVIDWAKYDLHPSLIEWADTVLVDCFPESWIPSNWHRLRGKRVIWRTIGQSGPQTETTMRKYRALGLEIVRYSPRERYAFERIGAFAGEDTIIRFGKDPADWHGWTGEEVAIGNLTQHDPKPHARDQFTSWDYFTSVTAERPVSFAGPNSEQVGGLGALTYDEMRRYLRRIRAYVATGTAPASYTLGLLEAMMTGTPTVIMPRGEGWTSEHTLFSDLYEASDFLPLDWTVPTLLGILLKSYDVAKAYGEDCRAKALELFAEPVIAGQWATFMGVGVEPILVSV
jgi:hypothetical protein